MTRAEETSGETSASRRTDGAPDVSILIVSYNTRQMTLDCIRSIHAETRRSTYEIIVVDNASSDGSAEALAALGDDIRFIPLKQNIGFARGNNVAATHARGKLLLLLNPDTLVVGGGIDRLVAAALSTPAAGIWGGRTLLADGRLDPRCAWRHMSLWTLLCRTLGLTELFPASPLFSSESYGAWPRDTRREVDIITGCFLLIGAETWRRLGGFDRRFFMYAEEADLCLRAQRLGARPLFVPEAVIIHYGGASEATWDGKVQKLLTAKVTFMRRHWSPAAAATGMALLACWPLSRWLMMTAAGHLLGRTDLIARARQWRTAWTSRRTWLKGYAPPETDDGMAVIAAAPSAI